MGKFGNVISEIVVSRNRHFEIWSFEEKFGDEILKIKGGIRNRGAKGKFGNGISKIVVSRVNSESNSVIPDFKGKFEN
jgi:hypothetical protein